MRVTINLASRPFVELGPLLARLRLLAGALVLVLFGLWLTHKHLERKAEIADDAVSRWQQRTSALEQEWQQDQDTMREPQNAAVQAESAFLNNLFTQKSFSWTAALMDLENVLPGGLQVLSMQPQMSKTGTVLLRLQVTGARDKAVELVKNLETSKHFLHPRLAGESAAQASTGNGRPGAVPLSQDAADVNFDILAEYNAAGMDELPKADTSADQKDFPAAGTLPVQPVPQRSLIHTQSADAQTQRASNSVPPRMPQPRMQPSNTQPLNPGQRQWMGANVPQTVLMQNRRQIYVQNVPAQGADSEQ